MLGGSGNVLGPVVGALFLTTLPYVFQRAGDYIGAEIAKKFAAEGFTVFLGRRQGEKLEPLAAAFCWQYSSGVIWGLTPVHAVGV